MTWHVRSKDTVEVLKISHICSSWMSTYSYHCHIIWWYKWTRISDHNSTSQGSRDGRMTRRSHGRRSTEPRPQKDFDLCVYYVDPQEALCQDAVLIRNFAKKSNSFQIMFQSSSSQLEEDYWGFKQTKWHQEWGYRDRIEIRSPYEAGQEPWFSQWHCQ